MFVKWNEKVYIHNDLKFNIEDIKQDLFGKEYSNLYCIIRALDGRNLYEIMRISELSNGLYNNKEIEIMGIAKGKRRTKEVLIDIIKSDCLVANRW
ncbi:MAG: hypothetical protein E7262_05065 [Lachnospiraceae bacterium]|nr:hypothetical protein [Lachnospiraceae bacterium]